MLSIELEREIESTKNRAIEEWKEFKNNDLFIIYNTENIDNKKFIAYLKLLKKPIPRQFINFIGDDYTIILEKFKKEGEKSENIKKLFLEKIYSDEFNKQIDLEIDQFIKRKSELHYMFFSDKKKTRIWDYVEKQNPDCEKEHFFDKLSELVLLLKLTQR